MRNRRAVVGLVAVAALLVAAAVDAGEGNPLGRAISGASFGATNGPVGPANLSISPGRPAAVLSPDFWGVNTGVYYRLTPTVTQYVQATPITFLRWPSGDLTDRYNVTGNRVYADSGSSYAPPTDEGTFVRWCESIGCHAIVGVPAEIDDPATAAYEVAYTERTLGFHPDYWEIGNEPALWKHFGTPWSQWNTSQERNATPVPFAQLVQRYVAAMKAVDPNLRIVGLSGIGTGAFQEPTWIRAVVALNGPNLTAVGIHVFPAIRPVVSTGAVDRFFASLSGQGSLANRVPRDRQAILAACPSCRGLELFVTEANAATAGGGEVGGPFGALMSGQSEVPYLAAEAIQAMTANATSFVVYSLDSTYEGALLNGSSQSPRPGGYLYAQILSQLTRVVLVSSLASPVGGVYAIVTGNASGNDVRLMLVNANTTTAVRVALAGSGFPMGPGLVWRWGWNDTAPVLSEWSSAPSEYTIYPESVALLRGTPPNSPA